MDDLAVARGGLEADRVGAFEDDDLVARQRQRARRRQPDDPGADHDRFDLVHRWIHRRSLTELKPGAASWPKPLRVQGRAVRAEGNSLIAGNFPPSRRAGSIRAASTIACKVRSRGEQGTAAGRAGKDTGRTAKLQGSLAGRPNPLTRTMPCDCGDFRDGFDARRRSLPVASPARSRRHFGGDIKWGRAPWPTKSSAS